MASLVMPSLKNCSRLSSCALLHHRTCIASVSTSAIHRPPRPSFSYDVCTSRASTHTLQSVNRETASMVDSVKLVDSLAPEDSNAIVTANQNGRLGFGFSAGGLLFPYFVGVITELDSLEVITVNTPMAGASAGSLIVASYKSGVPMDEVFQACLEMCKDLRSRGTRFRLGPVLKGVLETLLPEDIHERCSGSGYVAVTTLYPKTQSLLVNRFESKKDLIETLLTSCHIPFYFNGFPMCMHRKSIAFDGGITNFLPNPMGVDVSVRVSCFPKTTMRFLRNISISPDAFEEWPYSVQDMLAWAFEPGSEEVLKWLHEKGRRDARAWVKTVKLPAVLPAEEPLLITPPELVVATAQMKQGGT